MVSIKLIFRHFNKTFSSSHIACSAYQKWPTKHFPFYFIWIQLSQSKFLTNLKFENKSRLFQPRYFSRGLEDEGLSADEIDALLPFKVFQGNQPSTTLLLPRLDAYHLGALVALYEHKVFVQGVVWGINSFDQWGVELGKRVASRVLPVLEGAPADDLDASTRGLVAYCQRHGHR